MATTDVRSRRRDNLVRLLAPKSIAVVGVSSDPAKAGTQALRALGRFRGEVVGVHRRESRVVGVPCYPTVAAIPNPPDLAILAIPAEACLGVAEQAASSGVLERADFPYQLLPRFAGLGIIGTAIAGYGCPGLTRLQTGLVAMELSRGDGSVNTFNAVHSGLVMGAIDLFGQRRTKGTMAAQPRRGPQARRVRTHGTGAWF